MRAHIVEDDVVVNTIEVDTLEHPTFMLVDGAIGGIGWSLVDGVLTAPPSPVPTADEVAEARRIAYAAEADPLFFSWQAAKESGAPDQDARRQVWRAKRAEIQARFPYPGE